MVPDLQTWFQIYNYDSRSTNMVPDLQTWFQIYKHDSRSTNMVSDPQTLFQILNHDSRSTNMVPDPQTWFQICKHDSRSTNMISDPHTWFQIHKHDSRSSINGFRCSNLPSLDASKKQICFSKFQDFFVILTLIQIHFDAIFVLGYCSAPEKLLCIFSFVSLNRFLCKPYYLLQPDQQLS